MLLGVGHGDDDATADALARRICELRIFEDEDGRTNRSLLDTGGAPRGQPVHALRGHAPRAPAGLHRTPRRPELAKALWLRVADGIRAQGVEVGLGEFGAAMEVELVNDGPFTIWLDTADR